MNILPEVAKALGIALNEEFNVITPANIKKLCRFYERGNGVIYLEKYNQAFNQWTQENTDEIGRIVVGSYKVEKLPFTPKKGEGYWYIGLYEGDPVVLYTTWNENTIQSYERKYCGNVFRTQEDAEFCKYEIYKLLTGKEWNSY